MQNRINLIKEWLERAENDFDGAQILFDNNHFTGTVAVLIHQATEKYLKGFLILKGWKLEKIHDLEKLITEAIKINPIFDQYLDFARRTTAYYIEDRYPPGPTIEYPKTEIKEALLVLNKIKTLINKLINSK